jgi:hypothetical protein
MGFPESAIAQGLPVPSGSQPTFSGSGPVPAPTRHRPLLVRALNIEMPGQFTIRFYRLKDSVMCDRAGVITSGSDLVHTASIAEAQQFSRNFVTQHPALGCLVYRPDGAFAQRIPADAESKPGPTRRRSWLLAGAQLIPAAALIWWDAANDFRLILPTLLAARLIYGGLFKAADGVFGAGEDQAGT